MADTRVPGLTFPANGPLAPETGEILLGVHDDWRAALGKGLDVSDSTPQGQLMTSETAIIAAKNAELLTLANMFNPLTSDGVWQDALAKIYFIDRKPAEPTLVNCKCVGLAGTLIPVTALVRSSAGDLFAPAQAGRIPATGELFMTFRSVATGPVPAPAGDVSVIYKAIPGWDSVSNPAAGTLGRHVESRLEFEERRFNSVAKNGHGSVAAIYGEIANISEVIDCVVRENVSNATQTIGGVQISGHSIYASVAGGADLDVAEAIFRKKDAGCGMDGNTEVTVYWRNEYGESVPYAVRFQRPADLAFKVRVALRITDSTPADIAQLVQGAVVGNFYGLLDNCHNQGRVKIGQTVYASRFYADVVQAGAVDVVQIEVDYKDGAEWADFKECRIDQLPVLSVDDVLVETTRR